MEAFVPANMHVSALAQLRGHMHGHTGDSGLLFVVNDQHGAALHPCQDYPIQLF